MEITIDLKEKLTSCVNEIIEQLTLVGKRSDKASKLTQARMILELTNQLVSRMIVNYEMMGFLVKLLDVTSRSKSLFSRSDLRYFHNTLDFVVRTFEKIHIGGDTVGYRESLVAMK